MPLTEDKKLGPTRVFLDELPWDIRSKNTDWRYVRYDLPKLSQYEPSLHLTIQSSRWITVRENLKIFRAAAGRRAGFPLSRLDELTSRLSIADLSASQAEVIFAHRAFPMNSGGTPVVFQNAVLDPQMQIAYGATQSDISAEIEVKGPLYRRAAAVQVSTDAEVSRLRETFPDIADRFIAVPFFTPHVRACDEALLQRHLETRPVRILFTGNQVWRKGLDLLVEAFTALPLHLQNSAELRVISNFVGRPVSVPHHPKITVLRGINSTQVLQEMAEASVFVNVARFESYGLVFHEAMSQGLACLAPDWEVQRELFDHGKAGCLLQCNAASICSTLEELILSPQTRFELGLAAWKRFQERYAPAVVAHKYAEMFRHVATEHTANG